MCTVLMYCVCIIISRILFSFSNTECQQNVFRLSSGELFFTREQLPIEEMKGARDGSAGRSGNVISEFAWKNLEKVSC